MRHESRGITPAMILNKAKADIRVAKIIMDGGYYTKAMADSSGIYNFAETLEVILSETPLGAIVISEPAMNEEGETVLSEHTVFYRKGYAVCPHCGMVTVPLDEMSDCQKCHNFAAQTGTTGKRMARRHAKRIMPDGDLQFYNLEETPWTELPL